MSYQALYRKFRPQTFEEVKGQDSIVTTLKNQIKNDRVGHAYLFCGTRGTGKTSIAKLFAKAVNCLNPNDGSPCGECAMCKAIAAGASLNVIEMDAASNNGVEDVRQIVDEVTYSPTEGSYKVYIIDEVHMLSTNAFNALLKTLEEPPSYVIFILATTEVHKIPITILSRCQRYDFKRISIDTIAGRLRELVDVEGVQVEEKALKYIAKCADGSMRDALSLLDQCIAFYLGMELTYDKALEVLGAVDTGIFSKLLRFILENNISSSIHVIEDIVVKGRELSQFVTDFTWYLRNLMLVKTSDDIEDVIDVSTEHRVLLQEEAAMIDENTLMRYIRILSELSGQLRFSTQKRVLIEMAIVKLCTPQMEKDVDSLVERIRFIEEKLERGEFSAVVSNRKEMPTSEPEREKVPLPKALPEDVRSICENWKKIQNNMDGLLKSYSQHAKLSVENDKLIIVFMDNMAYEKFMQEGSRSALNQAISECIGKSADFEIRLLDENKVFDEVYPDISKVGIAFDIEEL